MLYAVSFAPLLAFIKPQTDQITTVRNGQSSDYNTLYKLTCTLRLYPICVSICISVTLIRS